eukprot:8403055-Lingulodinium_polyedra.AAC.1
MANRTNRAGRCWVKHPGKRVLPAALLRLDIAAMLRWRERVKREHSAFRRVALDAPPQIGTE